MQMQMGGPIGGCGPIGGAGMPGAPIGGGNMGAWGPTQDPPTLSSMLVRPPEQIPPPAKAAPEDPAKVAARRAAASAAAAAFAQTAARVAETSRDAARDMATAKAAAPAPEDGGWTTTFHGNQGSQQNTDQRWADQSFNAARPPVKLWVPEATAQDSYHQAPQPPMPPAAPTRARSQERRRSRSRRKEEPKRRSPSRRRRRGGGWDNEAVAPAPVAPAPTGGGGFAMSAMAQPSRPALPPGATSSAMRPPGGMNVSVNRFGVPEATPEALAAAVFRAQQVEAAGLEAIRATGQIPRGPPDLPTGTEVLEQKCVAYLIGKGGQALAAINAAAGVSIQIDQSTKTFGWSMANIYGTEEGAAKAKMILRQKVSEYRPLRG